MQAPAAHALARRPLAPPRLANGGGELDAEAAVDAQLPAVVQPGHAEDNLRGRWGAQTAAGMRCAQVPGPLCATPWPEPPPPTCRSGSHNTSNALSSSGRFSSTGWMLTATLRTASRNSSWPAGGGANGRSLCNSGSCAAAAPARRRRQRALAAPASRRCTLSSTARRPSCVMPSYRASPCSVDAGRRGIVLWLWCSGQAAGQGLVGPLC